MEPYRNTLAELYRKYECGEGGLTSQEAASRLKRDGENALPEKKKKGVAYLFFSQFGDLMTVILIAAAFLSGVLAFITKDNHQLVDTAILLFIILLNAVVGTLQQYRADKAIKGLKKLSVCRAKAVRDGKTVEIDGAALVVGDVIELSEGDRIPADGRILTCESFSCDESALTGESRGAKKCACDLGEVPLAERKNYVFSSTYCVSGNARCLVTATGKQTEIGKVADLIEEAKPVPSPLDKTIARLGKLITVTVLSVAAVLFIGGLIARRTGFLDNLMTSVAVAVAAIPEGMGAVVTVILALGVRRMSEAKAVVRKLSAVETLGSCSCICSDKTGTLTQNKMSVEKIEVDFASAKGEGRERTERILRCMRVCHTVKGERGKYLGDATEIALVEYADRMDCEYPHAVVGGTPFTSERKMMSVLATGSEGKKLYVKGGLEAVLPLCGFIACEGGRRAMTDGDKRAIERCVKEQTEQALRVLAFAEGESHEERRLTFLGIAAMHDPPRNGVKEAVEACAKAGVRTLMITGDSPDTAFSIAKRLKITDDRSQVVTGREIDEAGGAFAERVKNYRVFARVSPSHKTQIVRALQAQGEVVAMTGDGVNDAPSLKSADIGVAMGSGTDITKNVADMVLSDDNFTTMPKAVEEGRNVFYNIKKTIDFFLATNLAEVFAVLIATLVFYSYGFLTSTQLLWINLITDSLPVLALGSERTAGVMDRPPVSAKEILGKRSLLKMLLYGVLQTAIVITLFAKYALGGQEGIATTVAFLTLSFVELFHGFNVRMSGGGTLFSNKTFLVTLSVGVLVNVLLATVPFLQTAFSLTPLGFREWAEVFLFSFSIVPMGYLIERFSSGKRLKRSGKRTPVLGTSQ